MRGAVLALLLLASPARAGDDDPTAWVRVTTVSRDGQRVLGQNFLGGGPLVIRVFSATSGMLLSAHAFPELMKTLERMSRLQFIIMVSGNIPLTAEVAAAGALLRDFSPIPYGSASDDGKTVVFGPWRKKILLHEGALTALPETWLAAAVMPDGKALLFQTDDDEGYGLWRYDFAANKSVKLFEGSPRLDELTRVTPDRQTVRVPIGGETVCVADVPLAGKARETCYSETSTGFGMSEDGHYLVLTDKQQTIHLVDLAKHRELRAVKGLALGDDYKNYFEIDVGNAGRIFHTNMEIGWRIDLRGAPIALAHDPKAKTCVAAGDRGWCQMSGKLFELLPK